MSQEGEKKKTTATKRIETAKLGYGITKRMYARAREAAETGEPVAWVMGSTLGMTEIIIQAMDIVPIYPENYGAACAAKRAALPLLEACESEGFSAFVCGYARCTLGFSSQAAQYGGIPPDAPMGGMAKPIALIGRGMLCDAGIKWFQAVQRYFDVPIYVVDDKYTPVDSDWEEEEVKRSFIQYQLEELRGLVAFLEKVLGRKADWDKIAEMVDIGLKTRETWRECNELRKAIPCPMTSQDSWAVMVPGFWLPAEKESLEFYRKLKEELTYRVENKIGAIPNERYRLMFNDLPPWHTLELFDYLADLGAAFVIESFTYLPQPNEIPPGVTDPLERLCWMHQNFWARPAYASRVRQESGNWWVQQYLEWARDYHCDGAVMHDLLSCRSATTNHRYGKDQLLKHCLVPSLTIECDIVDERTYSEAQVKAQVEAFVETMEHYRKLREARASS